MTTIIFLLAALAILYLVMRLFEHGLRKGWDRWRHRSRGEEMVHVHPDSIELTQRPAPPIKREPDVEEPLPSEIVAEDAAGDRP